MPTQYESLRTWLEGRLDRQDALTQDMRKDISSDINNLRIEVNTSFIRKDVADLAHENLQKQINDLKGRGAGRLNITALSANILMVIFNILSYLHLIPHP